MEKQKHRQSLGVVWQSAGFGLSQLAALATVGTVEKDAGPGSTNWELGD